MYSNNVKLIFMEIKNFRSIKNSKIELNNLNIFVGLNDAGKSNYLKALNLFFNNETDYGKKFQHDVDFTNYYNSKSKKAKNVEIILTFELPDNYNKNCKYSWKKAWDIDSINEPNVNKIYPENNENEKLPPRSRIDTLLRKIKYRYIPAVKSQDIYKKILKELYFSIINSSTRNMRDSIDEFSMQLINNTKAVSEQILKNLKIESKISTPHNLSELFTALIIDTKVNNKNFNIDLIHRGDGIQVSHIPYLLEYIDNAEKSNSKKGSPAYNFIWGFEEPENGLEIIRSSELANKFCEFANNIQILLTTHSPAFYITKDELQSKIFYVKHTDDGTIISTNKADVSQSMGLLDFIAPIVKNEILKYSDSSLPNNMHCILVEGISDKKYIEMAINLFSNRLRSLMDNKELFVFASPTDGGVKNVCGYARARVAIDKTHKTLVLFDYDEAGRVGRDELKSDNNINDSDKIRVRFLSKDDKIINYYQIGVNFDYSIEHLLSDNLWEQILKENYLEENTSNDKFIKLLKEDGGKPYDEVLRETKLKHLKVFNNVKDNKKMQLANTIDNYNIENKKEILFGLVNSIKEIENYFIEH